MARSLLPATSCISMADITSSTSEWTYRAEPNSDADIASLAERPIARGIRMLRQYLVGAAASVCNIAIHALVLVAVIKAARTADELATSRPSLRLIAVMIAAVTVLMMAHLAEVLVWSLIYAAVNAAPAGTDLLYFAFVNYTTLGYGDVTPVERWHLLGPMTAMNGVLLFGWSTAVMFEVLRMTLVASGEDGTLEEKRWRVG